MPWTGAGSWSPGRSRHGEPLRTAAGEWGGLALPETAPFELGGVTDDLFGTQRAASRLLAEMPRGQPTIGNVKPA